MKNALDKAIILLKSFLMHTKIQDLSEAIQRRSYMMDLIKIKKLTSICAKRRRHYDPQCLTTFDDIEVINQLDMDLLCLQMKVKV